MEQTIDIRSKELLANVTNGLDFTIPDVDFNDEAFTIPPELIAALKNPPKALTLESLTERRIDGDGVFDAIMTSLKVHLEEEFQKGRITGAEYTKAYIAMMQGALQFAVQFLLGRDTAYYQALGAHAQAITMNIGAYTAKTQLAIAQAQAHQNKAEYANKVLALSAIEEQTQLVDAQTETQIQQKALLKEQTEQAHAQVSDTQLDGVTPVTGYTGKQNALLGQQKIAFQKDAIVKAAKIYADSLTTQLSMSSATVAGTGLDSNGIGKAIGKLAESMQTN